MTDNVSNTRTYAMSWRQALGQSALAIGIAALPMLRGFQREPRGGWATFIVGMALLGLASAAMFRWLLRVHVSADGIRGAQSRVMKWNEINGIEVSRIPPGLVVRSEYAPTFSVPSSVMNLPEFRAHVLSFLPSDHPMVRHLR